MAESRAERLARIEAAVDGAEVLVGMEDLAWLLEQVPEEWPCPNPDDPAGCYCTTRSEQHLEGATT